MLNEHTNVWEVSRHTPGLAGERTIRYQQEELQGFEFEAVLGEDGKWKLRPRPVASQIKEKNWPRMQAHPKEGVVTAFANDTSVD